MPKITPRRASKSATPPQDEATQQPKAKATAQATKKRKPIGRRLGAPLLSDESSSPPQVYTLSTGRKVDFSLTHISASDLETQTYVDQVVNGREQAALTRASVADLCETIIHQQFFPAIGRRDEQERIEILDGSRRRAAAIYTESGLDVLVTSALLTPEEARDLATAIQTAREHNLREVGLRLRHLLDSSDLTQAQLAAARGLSPAKVTRALQAASVPAELLSVFPVQSELNYPDYRALKELGDQLADHPKRREALLAEVRDQVASLSPDIPADQYKAEVMRCYREASQAKRPQPHKERAVVSHLWSFSDKNTYARKRTKGRSLSFEFNRLSASVQRELEEAVQEVLQRHLSHQGEDV